MSASKPGGQHQKDWEKVVKYMVQKCIQVIVQSRLGDKVKTSSKVIVSSNEWFNLSVESLPDILSETKKVFTGSLPVGHCVCVELSLRTAEGESMVLETWSLSMSESRDQSWKGYHTTYNKMCVLLKSLVSISRGHPGFKLSRKQGAETYVICYRIHTGSPQTQHLGMGYQTTNVGAISTPLGTLEVALCFRTKMLMSPQVSRDLTADLKDDHFCTDGPPKRTPSKPCQFNDRDARNHSDVGEGLSVGSSDSADYFPRMFTTSPADQSPRLQFQGLTGTSPPAGRTKRNSTEENAVNGVKFQDNRSEALLRTPKLGAFAPNRGSNESLSRGSMDDIPFMVLLQQPFERMEGTSSSGASAGQVSDVDSGDGTIEMDPTSRSTASSNKSTASPKSTGTASPAPGSHPSSVPDDYVMVELKTPFAGPDGNTDLGRFFRECQVPPALDMFQEQGSMEDTLNAITDQIATFEMNASQFDEFLDSLQDSED